MSPTDTVGVGGFSVSTLDDFKGIGGQHGDPDRQRQIVPGPSEGGSTLNLNRENYDSS